MKRCVIAAATLWLGAFALAAEETPARFSGTLDGEALEWRVAIGVDGLPSDWEDEDGNIVVRLGGMPIAEAGPGEDALHGTLEVEVLFMGSRQVVRYLSVLLDARDGSVYRSDHMGYAGDSSFVREDLHRDGERLHVSGRLEADLLRVAHRGSSRYDTENRLSLTADIAVTLPPRF